MKFCIKSLGCKTNALEAQIMIQEMTKKGFIETDELSNCDIFIINSCTVTSHSDNQALYLIKQAKSQNKNIKVILTGCGAQTIENEKLCGADLVLGNDEKLNIAEYIEKSGKFAEDIFNIKEFNNKFLYETEQSRPSLKIQEGCNNRCSYCLIPFARGNSRSNSIKNIIEQINLYIKKGKKEIVLTGTHIGLFGEDYGKNLLDLLKEIEKTDILRYRLGSLYVNEIDNKMFDFLCNSKKFCPHFHLSLQSLNDRILEKMNRKYTAAECMELINRIHKSFDLPYIGCDIITGFPTETEEDFQITKEALIEAKLSHIHSFPYSVRVGTAAEKMSGQVFPHIRKTRTQELISVAKYLHRAFLDKNRNTTRTVLYERKGKNDLYSGVTENYIKVYKKSDVNIQNSFETVNLNSFEDIY